MATLPAGLPIWLRWTLAAPLMAVALVGPVLCVVLIGAAGYPDRGDRSLLQSADNLYGSVWFVFAFAIPGVIAAAALWRQMLAWRKAYVSVVGVVLVLWTATNVLFDATDRDTTQPWIVPLGGGIGAWVGGYLLAMGAVRILTVPGARLADSPMEMAVPMRARPGRWPRHRGWIRIQWDRVRLEGGPGRGAAVMAWWAMQSVQVGEFSGDSELLITEVDSHRANPKIELFAGAGVQLHGEPGTLYASCDEHRAPIVADAIAARVAWAVRRPWTEGPDLGEAAARDGFTEGRDLVPGVPGQPFFVRGVGTLVGLSIVFGLGTAIGIYLLVRDVGQPDSSVRDLAGRVVYTMIVAGLAVYTLYLLRKFLRSQRYLEANDAPVPDQPPTPWLARGEPVVVRPEISEDPDQPFVMHKPVRSRRRPRPPRRPRRR